MKKKLAFYLLTGTCSIFLLLACNEENSDGNVSKLSSEDLKIKQPTRLEMSCKYIDNNWSSTSQLFQTLADGFEGPDTSFMYYQLNNIANMWGGNVPVLRFVHDPVNPYSTDKAMSSLDGRIYFGFALFYRAKTYGGNMVNLMILAHEYAHQLQNAHNLPSTSGSRAKELEADGYAAYYLVSPKGDNQEHWDNIAVAYNFVGTLGDYDTTSPDHHGTPAQRQAAFVIGAALARTGVEHSPQEFDSDFFYFYNVILNATDGRQLKSKNPKIQAYMNQHMEEIMKVGKKELSSEEFEKVLASL